MDEQTIQELRNLKYTSDDDNIRVKELVIQQLIKNNKIIHCIHNEALSEDEPEEYVGVNIRKSVIFPEVQDTPMNYIGIAISHTRMDEKKELLKYSTITFLIFCDERDLYDKETGIARHDLLASLIKEEFSYSNLFGLKATVTTDSEAVTDNHYMTRTLTFTMNSPNNITRNNRITDNYNGRKVL